MTTSQIDGQKYKLTIHLESNFTSKVKFFGKNEISVILGILCFTSLFTTTLIISISLILLIINRLIRILPTNIIINNDYISNYFKKVRITNSPYFDYHISINDNKVNVKLKDFNLKLKTIEDLPALTSEIANILNLEFENQVQLTNQSEVLTYRRTSVQIINYKSYLNVQKQPNHLMISEANNTSNWFNINLNTAIIRYSRDAFDKTKPIAASIPINNIRKIEVIIDQKAGVFFSQHQIRILIIEIHPTPVILHSNIDMIWNKSLQHFLLKTHLKDASEEITNLRDGEKIYTLLKDLSILKNIEIEKKIKT